MIKRMIVLILAALTLILGTGCLAPCEIDAYGYVISLGVDKGKDKKFFFTFMLQRESGDTATGGEGGAIILSEEGDDLYEALNNLEGRIPYALDFSRMNFVLFGLDAATDGSIEDFASFELETLLVRKSAVVMICEPTAFRFIGGMSANNDANITKLQSAILQDKEKTGMVSVVTLSRMMEACTEGRFDFCPALGTYEEDVITDMGEKKSEEEGEDPVKDAEQGESTGGLGSAAVGSALFDGWRMKDKLTRRETMLLNMASGEFEQGTYSVDTDKGPVSVRLTAQKHGIKVAEINAYCAVFVIELSFTAEPLIQKASLTREETERMIDIAAASLESELYDLFFKCREASCDAIKLGAVLSKSFRTVSSWEEYAWKSKYPDSEVRFKVILKESVRGD